MPAALMTFSMIGLLLAAGMLVAAALLQWLWNMTMPEALGSRPIRYWVAFRIMLIGALLSSGGLVRVSLPL